MAKVNLTHQEAFDLTKGCMLLIKSGMPYKSGFQYAINKNFRALKPEFESINKELEVKKPFEKDRIALCKEYAEKDPKGNPIMVAGNYRIPQNIEEEWNKKLDELKEKYKLAIKEAEDFMKQAIELEIHKVPLDEVPDILSNVFELIFPMIDGEGNVVPLKPKK